jgi:hypothetical protein
MSSAAAAGIGATSAGPEADAHELLQLLTPNGGAAGRLRAVDLLVPWPWAVTRVAHPADEELLVVRTAAPRTLQWILARRGIRAHVYALAPSLQRAKIAVPVVQRPIRGQRRLRDVLALLSLRLRARQLVGRSALVAVFVTRTMTPGRWLVDSAEVAEDGATVAATLSWRGRTGGATALVRTGPDPVRFVKVAFDERRSERLRREHESLETIAAAAAGAGIVVPAAPALRERDGLILLLEGAVDGRVAAGLPPLELERVFERLAAWLVSWHERTVAVLSDADDVVALARAAGVDRGYERWLAELRASLPRRLPRVAVHGDLTMWNVLVGSAEAIGVVDWEEARTDGPPLSDLFYSAVDAELAHGAHGERLRAFDAVFHTSRTAIAAVCRRATDLLGLDGRAMRLAFHETWLQHAADQAVRGDGDAFEQIVQGRLAVEPERYPWSTGA